MTVAEVRKELRRFMAANGMKQAEYARLAGVPRSFVCNVLKGRQEPSDRLVRPAGMARRVTYGRV